MEKVVKNPVLAKAIYYLSIVFIISSFLFDGYVLLKIRKENIELKNNFNLFDTALEISQKKFSKTFKEKEDVKTLLTAERQNNTYIQNQIQDITSTVGQLKKLSETDVELLKKYSKVYFLNENYVPKKLTSVDEKYSNIKTKDIEIQSDTWPYLKKMLDDANNDGVKIEILSGYRSFNTQAGLKYTYKITYGSGANKFSADQGYSEHQLGTTVDLTTEKMGAILTGFDKTDAYKWMTNNAYKYGFVLSYPQNNYYYIYEPWHWRFVGILLSTKLHEENLHFYDMLQRDIDQYLGNIFE